MTRPTPGKKQSPPVKRRCHRCHGSGRAPCQICSGSGTIVTGKDIYGNSKTSRCGGCFGAKTMRCAVCSGEGFI